MGIRTLEDLATEIMIQRLREVASGDVGGERVTNAEKQLREDAVREYEREHPVSKIKRLVNAKQLVS